MSATELESLTKLKTAGKLHFWRGTIEMPEHELHSICDEIQAEHARAIDAAMGRGECEDIGTDRFVCSKCGCTLDLEDDVNGEPTMWVDDVAACPRFCPNCGRRVRR